MKTTMRIPGMCVAALMLALELGLAAQAQDFPVKPIRFVSSAVGGPVDGVGRFLANGLTERFKQLGVEIATGSPAQFKQAIESENARLGPFVKELTARK